MDRRCFHTCTEPISVIGLHRADGQITADLVRLGRGSTHFSALFAIGQVEPGCRIIDSIVIRTIELGSIRTS